MDQYNKNKLFNPHIHHQGEHEDGLELVQLCQDFREEGVVGLELAGYDFNIEVLAFLDQGSARQANIQSSVKKNSPFFLKNLHKLIKKKKIYKKNRRGRPS